jgi:hypothetical protein
MRYGSTNSTVLFGVSSTAGHISAYDTSNFSTHRHLCLNADGGNVGISTTSPQEKFHLYGSPIIQHETRYNVGASVGWYKIGTWDAASATGARLKISLLGVEGYSAQNRDRGGETIIYASINNDIPTTASNMSGSIHAHGNPVITQAKFKQVGTDRTQYEIIAYVKTYTQHTMKIECSATTTFTRAFSSASDPGEDSATVQAALFTHVIDNAGKVGVGTTSPIGKLQVDLPDASVAGSVWDATKVVFGDIANNTSQGLGFGVSTDSHASIISLAPAIAWRGLSYYSSWHKWYINEVEKMRLDASGKVGIGTTNPQYPLSFERAGFGLKSAVLTLDSSGDGDFNLGELYVGDNVVSECIAIYNPTTEGSHLYKCGYVQWIQMKVRGQGVQGTIEVIKSYTADTSTVNVVGGGGNNNHTTVIKVSGGVANTSYTARVFYRALDTP